MNAKAMFRCVALVFLEITVPGALVQAANGDERHATLEHLERACEQARENALRPIRAHYVDECVQKGVKDRPACERFYADYGNAMKPVGMKFYDLPECVKAFNYRRSNRDADSG